ncbi:SFT2-domain-containing protein [Peniophora sp. CONT]|nr:SFT2-domain-containing protein [Peniophora sp. CONT]
MIPPSSSSPLLPNFTQPLLDTLIMAPANTEQYFRKNLSQSRWARDQQHSGAFGTFSSSIGISNYVPLRSNERSNEDEAYFALSRWERLLGFLGCLVSAAVCFTVAFFTLPLLALRPAKFALALSLGSLLVMFGFAVLIGPVNHIKHLCQRERLPFSAAYVGSLPLTLYFAFGPHSYIGSLVGAVIQSLVWRYIYHHGHPSSMAPRFLKLLTTPTA